MSEALIQEAFDGRLQTLAGVDLNQIAWFGTTFEPDPRTPYMATQMAGISRARVAAGDNAYAPWSGIYQITYHVPRGDGTAGLLARRDALVAHFDRPLGFSLADGTEVVVDYATPAGQYSDDRWVSAVVRVLWFTTKS